MLKIVVPMAGRGSRFTDAGYQDPKPLIKVGEQRMIEVVINNLRPRCDHTFVFICQQDQVERYGLREKLAAWAPGSKIVSLDGITEGAACTVLAAAEHIDGGALMIANSDQYVDIDINDYLAACSGGLDGLIMTMKATDPKWSFVDYNGDGHVTRVVEKEAISDEATVGIYNFSNGLDFVAAAKRMIADNERVNGEFYVAPVYNQMIKRGAKIGFYNVGSVDDGMHGLGTPADLDAFLASETMLKLKAAQ
ncbi:glycosyltransferase family 2 protein [Ensifer sp. Root278]|uniref:glycosyltransferase family 2 protein n=1 Tax=Ensifer sp. Root278 TaxID=1736509 RepID=UPI00070DAAB4|nr:glycosyltransferase family 2 protein [Ensifer sp. Root278]KRD63440.1 glycosyl transferase family 2 [Ensifer sp. Root278]